MMIIGGLVAFLLAVDAENKSLEEVAIPTINSHVMKARGSATLRPPNPPQQAERRDRSVLDRVNGDFSPNLQQSVLAPLFLTIGRFLLGMLPALVTVLFAGVIPSWHS